MKKSPLVPVLSVVLAVAVAGSAVAYAFVQPFKTAVNNVFTSPEDQIVEVNTAYFSNVVSDAFTAVGAVSDAASGEVKEGYKVSASFISGSAMQDEMDVDFDSYGISSVGIAVSSMVDNLLSEQSMELLLNEESLVTLNMVIDADKQEAYLAVPELSDSYVYGNVDDLNELLEENGVSLNEMMASIEDTNAEKALADIGITEEVLNTVLSRYIETAFNSLDDISRVTGVKGDVNGVDFKYTSLTAEITMGDVCEIAIAVLDELKTDKDIKGTLEKIYSEVQTSYPEDEIDMGSFDEFYEDFIEEIDYALEEVKLAEDELTSKEKNEILFTIVEWLNDKNEVVGFEVESAVEEAEFSVGLLTVDNDKNFAIEEWVYADGMNVMSVNGMVEKASDGAMTGEYSVQFTEEDYYEEDYNTFGFVIKLDDFLVNEEKNIYKGSFDMRYESEDESMGMSFEATQSDTVTTMNYAVTMNDETAYEMVVKTEEIPFTAINVPSYDYTVDEFEAYLENCDTDTFLESLETKLGEDLYSSLLEDTGVIGRDISFVADVVGMTEDEAYEYLLDNDVNSYDISVDEQIVYDASDDGIVLDYYAYIDSYGDICVDITVGLYENEVVVTEPVDDEITMSFEDINVNINGVSTKIPFKASLLNGIEYEDDVIPSGDYVYAGTSDFSIYLTSANEFDTVKDVAPIDGYIDYISIYSSSENSIYFNNITIGSSINDFNSYFGTSYPLDYSDDIYVEVEDGYDISFEYSFADGICSSMFADCYGYTVYDDGSIEY